MPLNDESFAELLCASEELLPYLEASGDKSDWFEKTAGKSRAQRLRMEADELEAKDRAVLQFRKAVALCRE